MALASWIEMFVRIYGETHYLWRSGDHDGEVLKIFDTRIAGFTGLLLGVLRVCPNAKRNGLPATTVTDRVQSMIRPSMKLALSNACRPRPAVVVINPADAE